MSSLGLELLQENFGSISQEKMITYMLKFFFFTPKHSEDPDETIARYTMVKSDVSGIAGLDMSYIGHSSLLLSALRIPRSERPTLLSPLGGELPDDETGFE